MSERKDVDTSERIDTIIEDHAAAEPEVRQEQAAQPDAPEEPPVRAAKGDQDTQRDEIAKRIRERRRAEAADEFSGDFSDPAQIYGDVGRPAAESDEQVEATDPTTRADSPAPTDAAPPKRILKVRKQEIEVTEEEMIALAQIGAAGESYLNEARSLREQAKQVLEESRRSTASRPHPDADDSATDELDEPPRQERPTPEGGPDFRALVDEIQFGTDPDTTAKKLEQAFTQAARGAHRSLSIEEKLQQDIRETLDGYETFKADHGDLLSDPDTAAALERRLVESYREDLIAAGVNAAELPKNTDDLADLHRMARVQGMKVRSAPQLMTDVAQAYRQKIGTSTPTQPSRASAPAVHVDRTARRAAIPSQPPRAASPLRAAPQAGRSIDVDARRKAAIARTVEARKAR